MIKKLIAPLQKMLMLKGVCPACTRLLKRTVLIGKLDDKDVVACKCGRVFIYNTKEISYKRALQSDLEEMISLKAGSEYLGKRGTK